MMICPVPTRTRLTAARSAVEKEVQDTCQKLAQRIYDISEISETEFTISRGKVGTYKGRSGPVFCAALEGANQQQAYRFKRALKEWQPSATVVKRSTSEEVTTPPASRRTPVIEGSADEVAVALDFQSDKEEIDYVSPKKEESK